VPAARVPFVAEQVPQQCQKRTRRTVGAWDRSEWLAGDATGV